MHAAVALALALAAALLLGWLHYAFWTWRLRVPSGEDELVFGETRDGWRIAVGRRLPRGAPRLPPVLLCHGLSTNRASLDSGMERYSLAAHLARAGFDCFALDLRGHGASRPLSREAARHWSFDDYLREDVPAALDAVERATGSAQVLWVGHSQGALLGMASCQAHARRIAALVLLAGPAFWDEQEALRRLLRWNVVAGGRWNRFLARSVAPFSGYWHPPLGELAINARNVERPVYRRLLANNIEDIPPGVYAQMAHWIREDRFCSVDGQLDYRAALGSCRQPALFVSAPRDGLAPPAVVEAAYRRWGGEKEYWNVGAEGGAFPGYGHTDIIYGRRAPEEIFPRVRDWLVAHSRVAAGAA